MSQCAKMWLFLLMFLLAKHLDLNQITVGSKADVHMMMGRTGISSELLLTWACIAKGLQSAAGFAQLQSKMFGREIGLTVDGYCNAFTMCSCLHRNGY